jgi:hypothetical protein
MHGKEDTRDLESADLYEQVGFFPQVLKDWEVSLRVVADGFFLFFPKIMDWEGLLYTLGMPLFMVM